MPVRARIVNPYIIRGMRARIIYLSQDKFLESKGRVKRPGHINIIYDDPNTEYDESIIGYNGFYYPDQIPGIYLKGRIADTHFGRLKTRGRLKRLADSKNLAIRAYLEYLRSKNLSSQARILYVNSKFEQSRARLKTLETKLLRMKGRVTRLADKHLLMLADIKNFGTVQLTQLKARVLIPNITNVLTSIARIGQTDITTMLDSGARIKGTIDILLLEKARIKQFGKIQKISVRSKIKIADITKTISLLSRILKIERKLINLKGRVKRTEKSIVSARAFIEHLNQGLISVQAKIKALGFIKSVLAKGRILSSHDILLDSRARILKTKTTKFSILSSILKSEKGLITIRSNIERAGMPRYLLSRGRIEKIVSANLSMLANIIKRSVLKPVMEIRLVVKPTMRII